MFWNRLVSMWLMELWERSRLLSMMRVLRALGTRFRRLEDRSRWARLEARGLRLPGARERRPDEVSDN